jgi:serine protease Do
LDAVDCATAADSLGPALILFYVERRACIKPPATRHDQTGCSRMILRDAEMLEAAGSVTRWNFNCCVHTMTRWLCIESGIACLLLASSGHAQSTAFQSPAVPAEVRTNAPAQSNLLRELNSSLEAVVAKVSPAVVQIMVTGYGPLEEHGETNKTVLAREHAIGSGIIVDPDGYIMTNAHVVQGAQRIRVILPPPPSNSPLELQPIHATQIFEATLVGKHKDSDLALLKIEATHLPTLHLNDGKRVRQGELVFAIGSPEGLQNSVTMGMVSSVSRQPDPDDPVVYIQTDAAMNPGNSGGALVDIDGELVGINTLMLSAGGGSEGLGFAIPAAIVNFDYQNLRKYGHVERVSIGATAQDITPTLAAGLGLARSWGAIISDMTPGGLAQAAGLKMEDIVLAIDDRPILSLPEYLTALYLHHADQVLKIDVLRGSSRMSFNIPVTVHHDKSEELDDLPDLPKSLIHRLSIFVTDLNDTVRQFVHDTRSESGIVVVAQAAGTNAVHTGLQAGDVIRQINRTPLQSGSQLQALIRNFKSGDPAVFQIERNGKLEYLAFEMD